MLILGIETSCDDTCVALVEARGGKTHPRFRVLSNVVSSQIKVHAPYGGIVPNLAAREHAENIVPVLEKATRKAKKALRMKNRHELFKNIDLIAVTNTPGLLPALLVGVHAARALAYALNKPILGVNHLEGHVYANLLKVENGKSKKSPDRSLISPATLGSGPKGNFQFPALALIVSGGHTQLVLMRDHRKFRVIGETRDDAAGEAFDKVAKLIGLPFPGGPQIEKLAQSAQNITEQAQKNAEKIPRRSAFSLRDSARKLRLPRPMIDSGDYDFSFSGLKTAVLYLIQDLARKKKLENKKIRKPLKNFSIFQFLNPQLRAELCAEFQQAVIDVLIAKTVRAAKKYRVKTVILGGGVAANKELRRQMAEAARKDLRGVLLLEPPATLAVDNAAMIAAAAYFQWLAGERKTWRDIRVRV